jgi:hypothetical protein
MLGVRRTTVTVVARRLQADGLIHYHRGHIVVLNRVGLEELACECYTAIRRRTEGVGSSANDSSQLRCHHATCCWLVLGTGTQFASGFNNDNPCCRIVSARASSWRKPAENPNLSQSHTVSTEIR